MINVPAAKYWGRDEIFNIVLLQVYHS